MEKKNATTIYKFVLKEINGWSDEEVDELLQEDIECDPLFEKIMEIK